MRSLRGFLYSSYFQEKYGGWVGPDIVTDFVNYANICFELFGDRVKTWITINEPQVIAHEGYGNGKIAPGIKRQEWIARHHTLLGQGRHLVN